MNYDKEELERQNAYDKADGVEFRHGTYHGPNDRKWLWISLAFGLVLIIAAIAAH